MKYYIDVRQIRIYLLYSYHLAFAPIAQLVEQIPLKDTVPGSSPGRRTTDTNPALWQDLCVVRAGAMFCQQVKPRGGVEKFHERRRVKYL